MDYAYEAIAKAPDACLDISEIDTYEAKGASLMTCRQAQKVAQRLQQCWRV